jgi:transcriptional regulator with XRE-family HTH domain
MIKEKLMDDSFGSILRSIRLNAKIGLRELARLVKISPGYLSDVEIGRVPPPSESVILDIAKVLNADRAKLLSAASKVDPELSDYVVQHPDAADFLRMAKDQKFSTKDWQKLIQLVRIVNLGKGDAE